MDSPETKNLLFVFDKPPHSSTASKEGIDALLTASAFGQNVTLLLIGDGVYQVLGNQDPSSLPAKNTASMFQAFEMYGIENIFISRDSLEEKGLSPSNLSISCDVLDDHQIAKLYTTQHQIFTF